MITISTLDHLILTANIIPRIIIIIMQLHRCAMANKLERYNRSAPFSFSALIIYSLCGVALYMQDARAAKGAIKFIFLWERNSSLNISIKEQEREKEREWEETESGFRSGTPGIRQGNRKKIIMLSFQPKPNITLDHDFHLWLCKVFFEQSFIVPQVTDRPSALKAARRWIQSFYFSN